MAVEIYLEPELEEMVENQELISEWEQKCKELGLEGQLSLIQNKEDGEKGSPSPYTYMTEEMMIVFAILCPVPVDYKKYDKTTIPIEVLSHIALCEKEGYFQAIRIWYDDTEKDPVVVGYIDNGNNPTKHLIARFGAEVLPYEILKSRAKERIKENAKSILENISVNQMVEETFTRGNFFVGSGDVVTYRHKYI